MLMSFVDLLLSFLVQARQPRKVDIILQILDIESILISHYLLVNILRQISMLRGPEEISVTHLIVPPRHELVFVSFLGDRDFLFKNFLNHFDLFLQPFMMVFPLVLVISLRLSEEIVLYPIPDLFLGHLRVT